MLRSPDSLDSLISTISGGISNYFYNTDIHNQVQSPHGVFLLKTLHQLEVFLVSELIPKMVQLCKNAMKVVEGENHEELGFESPLNFIMVQSDFRRFSEHFYQAEWMIKYSLIYLMDSLFTLNEVQAKKKQEVAFYMLKNLGREIANCMELLNEYHHLLEHDNFDCYKEVRRQILWFITFI